MTVRCHPRPFGRGAVRTRQFDEAVKELRAAIALKADRAEWFSQLGEALNKQKDTKGAIEAYRQAQILDPKDVNSGYTLGYLLQNNGDLDEAASSFEHVVT